MSLPAGSHRPPRAALSTASPGDQKQSTDPPGILYDNSVVQARKWNTNIPTILPHERVFPIQIGSELFRLSGASISSDAPSYFSQFFMAQLKQAEENGDNSNTVRTLYIDRDPLTFRDISLHLQGYSIQPRDPGHFVRLFADAQFYSLPRLMSQLYEENIFISIGNRDFQIPRELFSDPGNTPNYFSLGFAIFFSTPPELYPGLSREGLLRPPSIQPPSVPNRSADIFAELVHILRGYPIHIRNEEHREELLRDCRYFHLKGLEQKLIPHDISFNLSRQTEEIALRLQDLRQSGISVTTTPEATNGLLGWVAYSRPFADDKTYELVVEIGNECMRLHLHSMRAELSGDAKTRISRLFDLIATRMSLPNSHSLGLAMKSGAGNSGSASPDNMPIGEDHVKVVIDSDAWVQLDGKEWRREGTEGGSVDSPASSIAGQPPIKRRRTEMALSESESWIIKTGQWRLRVQQAGGGRRSIECILVAVKLDAMSGEAARNARRGFLAG